MPTLKVTCAVIYREGRFLAAQRSERMSLPHKWEFPGGKLDEGESPEACIVREILEELGTTIRVEATWAPVHYSGTEKPIILIPLLCRITGQEPVPLEHSKLRWISIEEFGEMDWAEADLDVLEQIRQKFGG